LLQISEKFYLKVQNKAPVLTGAFVIYTHLFFQTDSYVVSGLIRILNTV